MLAWNKKLLRNISGRRLARYISTSVLVGMVSIIATVFQLNIEVFATKIGADSLFSSGYDMIIRTSAASYLVWAFWLVTGVTATLWTEFFLKKFSKMKERKVSKIFFSRGGAISYTKFIAQVSAIRRKAIEHDLINDVDYQLEILGKYQNLNTIEITIDFAEAIEKPAVIVIGERGVVHWKLASLGKSHAKVMIHGILHEYNFVIEIAEDATEQEIRKIDKYYPPLRPRVEDAPLQLQSNIESETQQ